MKLNENKHDMTRDIAEAVKAALVQERQATAAAQAASAAAASGASAAAGAAPAAAASGASAAASLFCLPLSLSRSSLYVSVGTIVLYTWL